MVKINEGNNTFQYKPLEYSVAEAQKVSSFRDLTPFEERCELIVKIVMIAIGIILFICSIGLLGGPIAIGLNMSIKAWKAYGILITYPAVLGMTGGMFG